MPRERTIIDDFLDALKGATIEFVEARIVDHIPQQPRSRRVNGKAPKAKAKAKAEKPAKREAQGPQGYTIYDDLEVSPRASAETIRAAWLSLSKRYHPDVSKYKGAAERMKQINAAWDILGDEKKRAAYNREKGIR